MVSQCLFCHGVASATFFFVLATHLLLGLFRNRVLHDTGLGSGLDCSFPTCVLYSKVQGKAGSMTGDPRRLAGLWWIITPKLCCTPEQMVVVIIEGFSLCRSRFCSDHHADPGTNVLPLLVRSLRMLTMQRRLSL